MSEEDATSSPMPSEIIANTVPARLVITQPMIIAKTRPPIPPNNGMNGSGIGQPCDTTAFIMWQAAKPPRP